MYRRTVSRAHHDVKDGAQLSPFAPLINPPQLATRYPVFLLDRSTSVSAELGKPSRTARLPGLRQEKRRCPQQETRRRRQQEIPAASKKSGAGPSKKPDAGPSKKPGAGPSKETSSTPASQSVLGLLNRLPRYLWAAFGRARGPLKRRLRRRNSGRRALRAYPWSRARCVNKLFNVQWFETQANHDEVGMLMRSIRSPRPNRAYRRSAPDAVDGHDGRYDADPSRGRRHLFPDVRFEYRRRLSDLAEEEREERVHIEAERDFVDNYSAALPADGEFVNVGEEDDKRQTARGVKRKAEDAQEEKVPGDAAENPGEDDQEEEEEEEEPAVVRLPVRRKLEF
ncbi:LOW QUALITY PROTEIN: hypothetical protein ElyMa_003708800 [Elysia marginata]|uniref:Uncharacterized protein n=1 Tax=Elysia marginata TaxID=1093978 RepID=A0AAV4F2S9_9GAST|nr:LOW QUALITY PROTEIN: hypothetical protein ElyMa_003708800 [Elysia marginata]